MPFDFSVSVPAFTVFLQGILSFFSPVSSRLCRFT